MRQDAKILLIALGGVLALAGNAPAIPVDALDTSREWRTAKIEFRGNDSVSDDELAAAIVTRERPWYRFWEDRPLFDPITFTTDLERVRRLYEARGYYSASIGYDLEVDRSRGTIDAQFTIREGEPVHISEIDVGVAAKSGDRPPPLPESLPVKRGEIFREVEYQQAEQALRTSLLDNGYAHAQTERKAEVNLDTLSARIEYAVRPGPIAYFGDTTIKGIRSVEPEIISRELTYSEGELYSLKKVTESRDKLLALELFGTVRLAPADTPGTPVVVPMEVEVAERPYREIRLGVGYGTEDQFRSQLEWRHLNWLGGGRRLSAAVKYSAINIAGLVNLEQPHFLSPKTKGVLTLRHDQEDEETYLRNATRFLPRVDHRFSTAVTGFLGYRAEYSKLNDIDSATRAALGEIRREGFVFGPTAGLVWSTADDPFNPKKGHVVALTVDQAGAIWGGNFSFFKITSEAKKYIEVGWNTIFASRLKLGVADAIGRDKNFPLFERFFAGGEKSVRGYGRRRLGPLSASDDPLGGLSLVEGSLELRHPLWKELNGAVFLDFGQVSRQAFDLPFGNLRFSSGFGVSYATPVGPIRLDIGFPFKPPPGDSAWQLHFSIGAYF